METMSHACRRCGAERRPEARFCPRCGQQAEAPPTLPDITAPDPAQDTVTALRPGLPPPAGQHPYPPAGPPPLLPGLRPLPGALPAGPPGPRSRRPAGWIAASVVVIGVAVAIAVIARPFALHSQTLNAADTTRSALAAGHPATLGGPATATPGSAASPAPVSASLPAAPAAPAAARERQAASSVAGMLTQSVSDRSDIAAAYADVARCGPSLNRDAAVFTRAAASRRTLLASLASMPGRSALPPALLPELTGAWRASLTADQDYARWAGDEASGGCTTHDTADPGYQAAAAPDGEATADKQAFTAGWNPIAARYGLTQYQPDQL